MKESVGYTVTINIIIIFIVIVFTFLSATLIYFKSNKVSNIIASSIEKYEGYNSLSEQEILKRISSLGYNSRSVNCANTKGECTLVETTEDVANSTGSKGYCVYYCDDGNKYYHYKIRTNMLFNVPIINEIIDFPIFSNTNRLYNFEG